MFMSGIIYQPEGTKTRRNHSCSNLGAQNRMSCQLPKVRSAPKMIDLTRVKGDQFEVTVYVKNTSVDEGIMDVQSSGTEESDDSNQSSIITTNDGNSLLSTSTGSSPPPPTSIVPPSFMSIPQIQVSSATPTEPDQTGFDRFKFPGNSCNRTTALAKSQQIVSAHYANEAPSQTHLGDSESIHQDDHKHKCVSKSNCATEDGVQTETSFDLQIAGGLEPLNGTSNDAPLKHQQAAKGATEQSSGQLSCCHTVLPGSTSKSPRAMATSTGDCICLEMCQLTCAPPRNAHRHDDPPSRSAPIGSASTAVASDHANQRHVHHNHRLYGPERVACEADLRASRLTPSATMPMINSMDKCSKMWRTDPTEPYPAKARPKPIKFDIPSTAKNMASYFRVPPPTPSPTTPNAKFVIGNELMVTDTLEPSHATLHVSNQQHSIPPSVSMNSLSRCGAPPSTPNNTPAITTNMTNFVPVYISTKDLEAAFLNEPPPQYGLAFDQSKLDRGSNTLPPMLNQMNPKLSSTVKRTKSFQERLHKVLWGNGEQPPKQALSMRMSILGKPLPPARQKQFTFQQQRICVYNFLQRPRGLWAYAYHSAVAIVIILGLLFFALSTVPDLESRSITALRVLDIMILVILTGEFVSLFWASSCVGKYQGWRGKLRFVFSPFRLLDLLIIGVTGVVVWTCWLNSHQSYLQWLRCGMVFQILRLENRFKPWRLLSSVLWIERKHLLIVVYMGFLILVVISYVVYFLEQSDPDTLFTNLPVSLYWGVVTVLSVGYGDMAPKTTAGRIVCGILAILGVIIYAIPAGIIATGLALKVQERNREKHINGRRIPAARLIQCAWRCTAASANSSSEATWKQSLKAARAVKATKNYHRKWTDMYNGSRFNLIDEDDNNHSNAGSNRNSHNDLTMHNQELLSSAQKNAVRFIRAIKYEVALKEFKNAFKPYDIKDVLQQYSEGHADVVGRVRCMQSGINTVHVGLSGVMKMMQEMQHNQTEKIDRLEQTVQLLVERLTMAQNGGPHHLGPGNHHHGQLHSPYFYSDASTIYAHTPTMGPQHHRRLSDTSGTESHHSGPKHSFVWPEGEAKQQHPAETTTEESPHSTPTAAAEDSQSIGSTSGESIYSTHSYCPASSNCSPKCYRVASKRHRHYSN